jgi:ribonuclease H2 subunit A
MVYGISYCPVDKKDDLKALKVDGALNPTGLKTNVCVDSKKLTEEERDEHFRVIKANADWLGFSLRVLTPADISQSMLGRYRCA